MGVAAAKKNAVPAVTLQVLALSLIIGYYNIEGLRDALDAIGDLNTHYSPWFAIAMTMVFGGVIPLIIESFQRKKVSIPQRSYLAVFFTLIVWAADGYVVSWFYDLQASIFGNDKKLITIVKKVLVDQFVFVPVFIVPFFTFLLLWRDCHFSFKVMRARLREKGFIARGMPLMISNWAVWIPAASIIYAFPLPLQLILMNFILVFWSLIITLFVEGGAQPDGVPIMER